MVYNIDTEINVLPNLPAQSLSNYISFIENTPRNFDDCEECVASEPEPEPDCSCVDVKLSTIS